VSQFGRHVLEILGLKPEQTMVLFFATELNAIFEYVYRSTAPRHVK